MLWGVANGLCGGIIVSFATDLTPESCRSEFLGLWKTVQAVGGLVLPPFFGVVSDFSGSLEMASTAMCFCALLTALWLLLFVPESSPTAQSTRPLGGIQLDTSLLPAEVLAREQVRVRGIQLDTSLLPAEVQVRSEVRVRGQEGEVA